MMGAHRGLCDGYADVTKMLASAYKEPVGVTMIGGTMYVHTTYPLCGRIQSIASKCGAKPVGG